MKIARSILKASVLLFFILLVQTSFSQNVGISSSSSFTPDASAGLDVSYTTKGLLIPRVALTATNAAGPIASPAISLLVYNTTAAGTSPNNVVPGYYYWNGTMWMMLSTSTPTASAWFTTGNAGTSYPTNYFGTTDNFGLHFKTAATHRLWIDSLGSVAVGTAPIFSAGSAREKFLVDAGSVNYPTPTGAFSVISGKGYLDSYLQLNIQNTSPTAAASSDIVASNDQATETTNYIDMGINSSANSSAGILGGASTAYLLATGNDFAIGNGALSKNLLFFTAGTTAPATNTERMRIDASGNVGIGNIAPTQKLDITGNLRFSGALMPNNNAGVAGYFLMSNGSGVSPTWFNANNLITTQAWGLTGNTGTTAGTNFLGTTDAVDFVVKTNNAESTRFTSTGNVGIGTTTPTQKLDVNGSINAANSIYIDGANSNTGVLNPGLYFGGTSSGEVISSKRTSGTNQYGIDFYTSSNNRMTIANTGNIGLGTITPSERLDIAGNLKFSGALMPNNDPGTAGYFLRSGGSGTPPIWFNASNLVTSQAWSLTGNTGTTAGTNFIGTTDATDFVVKTNSTEKVRISSAGDVAIGGTAFNSTNPEQLLVDAGSTSTTPATSFNVISGKGYIDKYLQLNIQNTASTTSASSDVVASNDAATETTNYVDLGINSSAYSSTGLLGFPNQAYLLATGNDFSIGNGTASKSLTFFTGGQATTNEHMRIDGNGNVGIGTTNPSASLHVNGTLKLTGSAIGSATDSLLTITTNLVRKIPTATYVNTASTQTITGAKTFSAAATFSALPSFPTLTAGSIPFGTAGTLSQNNANLFWSNTNLRLGIGTNAPSTTLDVNGIINAASSIYLDGANTNTGTKTPGLLFGGSSSGEGISSKRTSGTDQYGLDFYTASSLRMSITQTGSVGISTTIPVSTLEVNGSVGYPIFVAPASGSVTLGTSQYTVIIPPSSTYAVTLPTAASTNIRRIYNIVNQTSAAITIGNYINTSGTTVSTTSSTSTITVQSDGTNWYRIQ